jgi:iron complex outermembrane recepter protein
MSVDRTRGLCIAMVVIVELLAAAPAAAQEQVAITGRVTASDGTPQAGATVVVDSTGAATITDEQGRYTLSLPPGQHVVRVQAAGLADVSKTVVAQAGAPQSVDFQMAKESRSGEVIVVVGSRTPRTQLETSVPVDVITNEAIRESSETETNQLLNVLEPSFNASHLSVADGTDHIDPASLRGLGPEHVLVLVNGKRRQQSALVNFYNGGTVGVDLNAIPTSAIARVEVLRDGAASQYGSDAIAGVINIVLKDDVDTASLYAQSGITASGDGEQLKLGANGGVKLGTKGFVNVTGEFLARGRTNRSGPWPDVIFLDDQGEPLSEQATNAELMARGLTRDDFNMSVGQSGALVGTGFLNAAYPLNQIFEVYAQGGYTYRKGKASGFYRFPYETDRVEPSIYPDGFLPEINPSLNAFSATAGTRARKNGWEGDLSLTYGGDAFHFFVDHSINASLGPASPTHFDAGKLSFAQATANLDVVKHLEVGFFEALSLVAGSEVRHENYSITAGQPESYEAGTVTYDDDGDPTTPEAPKAPGAQVFPGFRPDDETDSTRNSEAVYAGVESKPIDRVNLDLGGRFEHYSDFGSTVIGKVAGRVSAYKTDENEVALRGSVSTGFRAPALQQIWYSTVATNFVNDPVTGTFEPSEIQVSPNTSPVTEAFGIPRLKEETSLNVSGGFTARLFDSVSLSADYYRVRIKDRVVLSGLFASDDAAIGSTVASILEPFAGVDAAQFFVNAVDTTTNGLDLVADYTYRLPRGSITATVSGNLTKTTVDDVRVPDSVKDRFDTGGGTAGSDRVQEIFLGRDGENRLEDMLPRRKGTFSLGSHYLDLSAGVRANYFGPTVYRSASTDMNGDFLDENYGSEVTFDVDIGYRIGDLRLGIGGNNVFNNFPDENQRPDNRYFDTFLYGTPAGGAVTPYGIEGAFYYVRAEYTL